MELIALAVLFALVFVPLFLASELASGHPDTARRAFRRPVDGPEAARLWLAAHPLGARRPVEAANDVDERLAA